jgi:uncharacterized membrane protein YphA (DoxX/SURF4 family)
MFAIHGLGAVDFALLIARLLLGVFFVLARFRFFWDPSRPIMPWLNIVRQESFINKLSFCGCKRRAKFWAWVAAAVEVLAGIGLIIGLLAWLSALGLLVVLLVATRCTWRQKVYEQHPVDKADVVCAYLWRVEGLYIGLAVMILLAGPGKYSLDHLLF